MPNSPSSFGIGKQLWAARPRPFTSLYQGTKRGALTGALTGATVGGPYGAVAGAAIGGTLSTLKGTVEKLVRTFKQLDATTRSIVDHYKAFSPIMARVNHQIRMTDRRINRMWARSLGPLIKQVSKITNDFQIRWEKMKIQLFDAIMPYLQNITRILKWSGKILLNWLEAFTDIITEIVGGLTKVLRFFGLLPKESKREPTKQLKPFTIDWPTVEGPLTGAMKRLQLKEAPFTEEERRDKKVTDDDEEKTPERKIIDTLLRPPILNLKTIYDLFQKLKGEDKKTEKQSDVKVEIKVGDSKELVSKFEAAWKEASYKLRRIEAEDSLLAFKLQSEGTFV